MQVISPWCCSEIRARYHPNPTPDRWPLESLPLGSETGIQVSTVVGIGDHLGRQLPVSLLVPVAVASVDTTLLPTKFWRRNGVEPEVGALVSILKLVTLKPLLLELGVGWRAAGRCHPVRGGFIIVKFWSGDLTNNHYTTTTPPSPVIKNKGRYCPSETDSSRPRTPSVRTEWGQIKKIK